MFKKTPFFLWLICVCAIAVASWGLKFDSDQWLSADHYLEKQLDYLAEEFEEGESLLLIIPLEKNFFSAPSLFAEIDKFEKQLSLIPGVLSSRSPLSAKIVIKNDDTLQIRSFGNGLETGVIKDAGQFQSLFNKSPYHGKLLSADGKTLAILMRVDTRNRAVFRGEVVKTVEETIRNSGFPGSLLAGDAALKAEVNRTVKKELLWLLLSAAALVAFFLRLFLRSNFQVGVLMTCMAVAVAQSFATVNFLGHSLTPVSLSLPLMISIIVIADGLHILSIWNRETASGNTRALHSTIGKTWLPCLVTSLTSAVGFGAFSVSELIPVRNFGIDSLVAIILCYPLLVSTIWGALRLFPSQMSSHPSQHGGKMNSLVLRLSSVFSAHRKKTALAFTVVSLVMACSLVYARTETNFLNVLFKKSSRITGAFDTADAKLRGSGSVEILIDGKSSMYFHDIENFKLTKQFVETLDSNKLINGSNSYLLPLEITHRPLANSDVSVLPQTVNELAQELFFLELSRGERQKDLVSPYLNFDSSTTRIEAQTPNLNSTALDSLIGFINSNSPKFFPDARIVVTGSGAYIHKLSNYVISTQVRSFALTFTVIGIVFLSVFGLRCGIAGFISNIFPVLVSMGMISLTGTPFDFATVLVAGTTLGLSVDDSIHFLHHYKKAEKESVDVESAIEKSLSIVANPIVLTSILFCGAIAVLCSSSLVVMIKFALFTIAGLTAAMVSALVFLPSLVVALRAKPEKAEKPPAF